MSFNLNNASHLLSETANELKTQFANLSTLPPVKLASLRDNNATVQIDVAGLKMDIAFLKTYIASLKTNIAGLNTDMTRVRTTL